MFDTNHLRASLVGPRAARSLRLCQSTVDLAEQILQQEADLKGSRFPGRVICTLIGAGIDQLEDEGTLARGDTATLLRAVNLTRSKAKTMVSVALTPRQWAAVAFLRQTLGQACGASLSDADVVRALAHVTVSEVCNAKPTDH